MFTGNCRTQSTLHLRPHFATSDRQKQILFATSATLSRVQTPTTVNLSSAQNVSVLIGSHIQNDNFRHCKRLTCKAGLEDDAPFAIAIGACVLSTLVIPILKDSKNDANSKDTVAFSPDDIRYAAMGVIGFIPLFNWMAWIFAWLDTNEQQYMIYAIVYLAPYLKKGLSLSPEDSWLPLASVVACIVHVQLEIAVKSEGLQDVQLKAGLSKLLLEKANLNELRERAEGLLNRLRALAEKTEVSKVKNPSPDQSNGEATPEKELQVWDEKLLNSDHKHEISHEAKNSEEEE